jgi:EAL and modified HD-GYP domain-containing signal transduction protein
MVNSAGFGLRREVKSIHEALVLMGLDPVRKWAALWALAGLNGGPSELVTMTVVRARTCETLGSAVGSEGDGYFLLGLCSLLDVLVGQPMDRVIEDLPVGGAIRDALLGVENRPRSLLRAVTSYERGEWREAEQLAADVGLDAGALSAAHADALTWARKVQGGASPAPKAATRH